MKLTANFAHTSVCCAIPESVIPHHGLRRRVVALQGEVSWLQGGKRCCLPTKHTFPSLHTRRSRAMTGVRPNHWTSLQWWDWLVRTGTSNMARHRQSYSVALAMTNDQGLSSKAVPNREEVLVRIFTALSHSSLIPGDMDAPYLSWSWTQALQPLTPGGLSTSPTSKLKDLCLHCPLGH